MCQKRNEYSNKENEEKRPNNSKIMANEKIIISECMKMQ